MDNLASAPSHSEEFPLLRRRNTISNSDLLVPTKLIFLDHHSSSSTVTTTTSSSSSTSSFPYDYLELLPIKRNPHSYTSLKDLLPSVAVNSPKPSAVYISQPGSDICIRNRLVKQAAWAYLQPMYTSPGPAGGSFFHRLWPRIAAAFHFICRNVRMPSIGPSWLSGSVAPDNINGYVVIVPDSYPKTTDMYNFSLSFQFCLM